MNEFLNKLYILHTILVWTPFTNYVTLHFCWSLVDLLHLITMRLIVTSPDMYNFADTSCDWVHAISSLLGDQQFNFKVQAVTILQYYFTYIRFNDSI